MSEFITDEQQALLAATTRLVHESGLAGRYQRYLEKRHEERGRTAVDIPIPPDEPFAFTTADVLRGVGLRLRLSRVSGRSGTAYRFSNATIATIEVDPSKTDDRPYTELDSHFTPEDLILGMTQLKAQLGVGLDRYMTANSIPIIRAWPIPTPE